VEKIENTNVMQNRVYLGQENVSVKHKMWLP